MANQSQVGSVPELCGPDVVNGSAETPLLDAYSGGDKATWIFVESWIRAVVCKGNWQLHEEKSDIIQEVHHRLLSNLRRGTFRGESTFKTYVCRVSKYTCIELLRRKRRRRYVDLALDHLADPSPDPEQEVLASERAEIAADAVRSMPESYRRLYDLVYRRRLDYETVGRRLGIATGTVKSRTSRFRTLLSRLVAEDSRMDRNFVRRSQPRT